MGFAVLVTPDIERITESFSGIACRRTCLFEPVDEDIELGYVEIACIGVSQLSSFPSPPTRRT